MQKGRVLLVEDDAECAAMLVRLLDDCEVEVVRSAEEALARVAALAPELVLLDVALPGMDGYACCRLLKADLATAAIPVIFLTGAAHEDAERRALQLGAADFVGKPVNGLVLQRRAWIQIELVRARAQLERLAATDALTGLANRREFQRRLEVEHARLCRDRAALAVLLIDVDHFKAYNDHYGHVRGDACLRTVATALEAAVFRPGDFVARFGGEEFACVLPETDARGARIVAERMLAVLAEQELEHAGAPAPAQVVTVSIGAAAGQCDGEHPPALLVRAADRQLYRAKAAGRGRVQVRSARPARRAEASSQPG